MATEEQTDYNFSTTLHGGGNLRVGQRLTIPNRTVTKLSFPLQKYGSPIGDVTFTIRKVSDDSLIASKVWGNASTLTTTATWREVTLDAPVTINEEVRIQVEFSDGNVFNYVRYSFEDSDVKANEIFTRYAGSYTDSGLWEGAYIYTYTGAGESLEKSLFDTLTISDSIVKALSLNKADTVAIADTLSKTLGLIKADGVTIADTIAKAVSLVKTDTVTIADAFSRVVSYVRSFADNVGITDSIVKAVSIVKTDTVAIADTMATVLSAAPIILKQTIARMQIKGMDIARMSINKMGIARMPLFRWIIRRWTA